MHELSVARSIVAIALEHAAGRKVRRVRIEIGRLAAVLPASIRFCFDVCARDTPIEGAVLEIVEIPAWGRCEDCGCNLELAVPTGRCPECGSKAFALTGGTEMNVRELEVEPCA